jgi:hypothetical protein
MVVICRTSCLFSPNLVLSDFGSELLAGIKSDAAAEVNAERGVPGLDCSIFMKYVVAGLERPAAPAVARLRRWQARTAGVGHGFAIF